MVNRQRERKNPLQAGTPLWPFTSAYRTLGRWSKTCFAKPSKLATRGPQCAFPVRRGTFTGGWPSMASVQPLRGVELDSEYISKRSCSSWIWAAIMLCLMSSSKSASVGKFSSWLIIISSGVWPPCWLLPGFLILSPFLFLSPIPPCTTGQRAPSGTDPRSPFLLQDSLSTAVATSAPPSTLGVTSFGVGYHSKVISRDELQVQGKIGIWAFLEPLTGHVCGQQDFSLYRGVQHHWEGQHFPLQPLWSHAGGNHLAVIYRWKIFKLWGVSPVASARFFFASFAAALQR